MKPFEEKFAKLIAEKREDNSWDYKSCLLCDGKLDYAELSKDFLAFSNFGGGYLVLGVDNSGVVLGLDATPDVSAISISIEDKLGFSIPVYLNYFPFHENGKEFTVGLLEILPGKQILLSKNSINNRKGKQVVGEGMLYTRRNATSCPGTPEDHSEITQRLQKSLRPSPIGYFIALLIFALLLVYSFLANKQETTVYNQFSFPDASFIKAEAFSLYSHLRIFPQEGISFLMDFGENQYSNRVSIYVNSEKMFCVRIIDDPGDAFTCKLLTQFEIPLQRFFVLGLQIGKTSDGIGIRLYVDNLFSRVVTVHLCDFSNIQILQSKNG